MPSGMRLLSVATLLGFGWFLWVSVQNLRNSGVHDLVDLLTLQGMASLIFATSLVLFWWTVSTTRRRPLTLAFTSDVPVHLQTTGPYAYVRHPFYLAYVLFWIGTAVAANERLAWAMPAVMTASYMAAARREELKFEASPLASDYRAYRLQTGMLVPNLQFRSGKVL